MYPNIDEALEVIRRSLAPLPSQQSPIRRSLKPYNPYIPSLVNVQNHPCIYCQRSHMVCDHERPCTRWLCIKRNIGSLCYHEPDNDDSKKSKIFQAVQTTQTDATSSMNSYPKSCHYTISRDHTEGAEDQKCKILADFGRKRIRTWTNLSLANINSLTAESQESVNGPESDAGQDGLPNRIDAYQLRRVARSLNSHREVSKINFDGFTTG